MFIYNLVVILYGWVIRMASISNPKAKLWVNGRKDWREQLGSKSAKLSNGKRIWVHCASLGEFEQGRPIIEEIKHQYPDFKIVLTFFSPSGFEGSKGYDKADLITYLPLDTKRNARDFLNIVKPDIAIFIKYEFWINFLNALKHTQTPSYLVSAVFKDHHPFFKWYGGIFRRSLKAFKTLMVQDEHSKVLLSKINYSNVTICGDTRFDRVLAIKQKFSEIPEVEKFKGSNLLIIGGSTWPKDEELIIEAFKALNNLKVKLLLAPHEIDEQNIDSLKLKLKNADLSYCLFTEGLKDDCKVLILNTMGMLSRSYYYADAAYIGGGFNGGIHNILEPAVYFIPVAFYGNDFSKYNEAVDLVKQRAANHILDAKALQEYWEKVLTDNSVKERVASVLKSYFEQNAHVTSKVMSIIDFG